MAIVNLFESPSSKRRVLFLGYDQSESGVIDTLIERGCSVDHSKDPLEDFGDYNFVVSFGYRHILRGCTIKKLNCPIFNLHISYLPYNRGAHPNFWSFYEDTPSGVTIHLVDEGVDTGPIVYQRKVSFNQHERTFVDTHKRLIEEIESLFQENVEEILCNKWSSKPQSGVGTVHFVKDLPGEFSGWNSVIVDEIHRLKKIRNNE